MFKKKVLKKLQWREYLKMSNRNLSCKERKNLFRNNGKSNSNFLLCPFSDNANGFDGTKGTLNLLHEEERIKNVGGYLGGQLRMIGFYYYMKVRNYDGDKNYLVGGNNKRLETMEKYLKFFDTNYEQGKQKAKISKIKFLQNPKNYGNTIGNMKVILKELLCQDVNGIILSNYYHLNRISLNYICEKREEIIMCNSKNLFSPRNETDKQIILVNTDDYICKKFNFKEGNMPAELYALLSRTEFDYICSYCSNKELQKRYKVELNGLSAIINGIYGTNPPRQFNSYL